LRTLPCLATNRVAPPALPSAHLPAKRRLQRLDYPAGARRLGAACRHVRAFHRPAVWPRAL